MRECDIGRSDRRRVSFLHSEDAAAERRRRNPRRLPSHGPRTAEDPTLLVSFSSLSTFVGSEDIYGPVESTDRQV